ncbi:MAG: helix-hairpin-helix domain-containing protein [Bacteroidota bacterium]
MIAQKQKNEVIAIVIEKLIENDESKIDYTDLQAQLEYYFDNKINLNQTNEYELQQLIFLKHSEIIALLNHRKLYGDFESIYELQAVANLSDENLQLLKYFCFVNENNKQLKLSELSQLGKTEIILQTDRDIEERLGFKTALLKAQNRQYYLGSPYRTVLRFKQQIGKRITIGYTGEKDAGEQFFQGNQKSGYDFNSGFIQVRNVGHFTQIILGDYQANFGQGLTFGSGLSARKSAFVLNTTRNFQVIRPYRSINEFEFLRGLSCVYEYKNWQVVPFISFKAINTNFTNADTSYNSFDGFTSFNLTGLHRTNNEIADKDNVNQTIIGLHVQKTYKQLQIGLTTVKTNYSAPLLKGDDLYQKYNFAGNELLNLGADYRLNIANTLLLGEVSISDNNALATTHTLLVPVDAKLDLCFLYRNFSRAYQTTFNNPFAENNDGRNEGGFYTGLSFKPRKSITFNAYIDFYKSSWLRYQVDAPSKGYDILTEWQYTPNKPTSMYIRYRYENKEHNKLNNNNDLNDVLAAQEKQQLRFHVNYKISLLMESESRIEFSMFNTANVNQSNGFLIFQGLKYKFCKNKMSVNARLSQFSIDNYYARIYAYEDNVPYTFSVPLYQNSGTRFYIVYKYQIVKNIKLFLRYAQTKYSNVNSIGSGLEQIDGNTQSDIITQLQIAF